MTPEQRALLRRARARMAAPDYRQRLRESDRELSRLIEAGIVPAEIDPGLAERLAKPGVG